MSRRALVLAAAILVVLAPPLCGQGAGAPSPDLERALPGDGGSFGSHTQDYWVVAPNFASAGFDTGASWRHENLDYYVPVAPPGTVHAPVELPAGALITRVSCYFHDADVTTGPDSSILLTWATYSNLNQTPAFVTIGNPIVSGTQNGYHVVSEGFNETIRFRLGLTRNFYLLTGVMAAGVSFRGCRIEWNRQVTAAPTSATFGDVPTSHPFFRFVEALAASGITAGCGPGTYCVNAPITRGEMAVFLATALGLHYPF